MKVTMKRCEQLAVEHAKRFTTAWDYFCVATGAYLAGYREGKRDVLKDVSMAAYNPKYFGMKYEDVFSVIGIDAGNELIESEVSDGTHQLAVNSFHKFQEEVDNLPFKEALTKLLTNYYFNDIRVDVDASGMVSFQGTARKKD